MPDVLSSEYTLNQLRILARSEICLQGRAAAYHERKATPMQLQQPTVYDHMMGVANAMSGTKAAQ